MKNKIVNTLTGGGGASLVEIVGRSTPTCHPELVSGSVKRHW